MDEPVVSLVDNASEPFRVLSLIIFVLAILHTFFANHFTSISEKVAADHAEKYKRGEVDHPVSFRAEILHFFGEIEIIFGLYVIPLIIVGISLYNWDTMVGYINTRDFVEPLFVVVIMSLTASKPIVRFAEDGLRMIAKVLGGTPTAWWLSILTLGPLLGSIITEAAAMTLCALLLAKRFYAYEPRPKLAYATLGLLFVNISVGGILTNFSAPPVLIVRRAWEYSSSYMFTTFGLKVITGIIIANALFYLLLRKDLAELKKVKHLADYEDEEKEKEKKGTPLWVTFVHLFFLFWVIYNSHYPAVFIGAFLLYLGFHQATIPHQYPVSLKRPLLVGLFLAGLIIHGGLQGWWIIPLLGDLTYGPMMFLSMVLTAFNDNAAVAYLATLIPNISDTIKYAVVSGVVVGGGLTVIANAPNPAGLVILKKYFAGKVSPLYLFFGAVIPTAIYFTLFYFFPG